MVAAKLLFAIGFYASCVLTRLATGQYEPTCNGLDSVVANVQFMECTRNDECDTVDCTITESPFDGIPLTMTLLSCRVPPGVHVVVRDSDSGGVILDRVIDRTMRGINLNSAASLDITLNQLDNAIGVKVVLSVQVFIFTHQTTLLQYTIVPVDTDSCMQAAPTTLTQTPTPTYTTQGTTDTPTPAIQETTVTSISTTQVTTDIPAPTTQEITETPVILQPTKTPTSIPPATDRTTCDVLAELAETSEPFDCVADTNEPCDRVDCTTELLGLKFTAEVVLLPCHSPPAVHITMSRGGKVVLNKTVDHSQEIVIPELFNLKLNVTLDHFQDVIGLQVDADIPLQPDPITIIKHTIIPLDKSSCNLSEEESQDQPHDKGSGVLEATAAIFTLISLLCFATGMV